MTYNINMDRVNLAPGENRLPVKRVKAGYLAWACTVVSILIGFLAIVITVRGVLASGDYRTVLSHQTLTPFITIAYAIIGGLVASHRPRNPIGWLFVAIGFISAFGSLANAVSRFGSSVALVDEWAGWLDNWLWIPGIILPNTFVFLIFPDGNLPSRRFRFVAWSAGLGLAITLLAVMLQPGPLATLVLPANASGFLAASPALNGVTYLSAALLMIGFFGSLVGLFVRFHRSAGVEREQMKWLIYAVGIELFSIILSIIFGIIWPNNSLVRELSIASSGLDILFIAIAAAIAILQHRLYDINLIINRTLVYTALTVGVAALYGLVVGGLGILFQASGHILISLVATGLAAILVQPMLDRLQRGINRLMYGERDDPYAVLSNLSRKLEGLLSPEATLPTVVETVANTLKLPYVAIALQQEGAFKIAASYGLSEEKCIQLPLIYQGETVGQLKLSTRSPNESFTAGEKRLLGDIALHIGVTAHSVLLTRDLRQLAENLQRSREQMVTTREEERRRIRRDLHDGLGPALASLLLKLDAARNYLDTNPAQTNTLLVETKTQVQAAIADIRRLVYELRPPALDELGLVSAIREQAAQYNIDSNALRVSVIAPEKGLPPLPAAVEVAAYRIALESLTNVVRHAQAGCCEIRISLNDSLQIEISDDGIGIAQVHKAGVGLTSMRERAAELGGTCKVESPENGGTRVVARIPIAVKVEV